MISMYSSIVQVCIVGFLAFAGPGLFNALNGLGAAGSGDPAVAAAANGTLYGFFAFVGYFSGVFFNILGPRICLFFGGLTYAVYAICMYYSTAGIWVAAIGGMILGCGAGVFWTSQSALMLAYATEHEKGKFTGIFWAIFNLGACLGGFLQMGLNWKYFTADYGGVYTVSGAKASAVAYWTFIIIMIAGSATSLFILAPVKKVRKSDGTHPEFVTKAASAKDEIKAAAAAITDPFVLRMCFYFFYSNWYYTFEFGAINGFFFNSRSAGMNAAIFRILNITGAQALGLIADNKKWDIMKRAKMTFFSNCFLFCLTWILAFVVMYTSCHGKVDKELSTWDPEGNAELGGVYTLYAKHTIVPDMSTGSVQEVGGTLINRLAWFPGGQTNRETGEVMDDGCEWLKVTKEYFRNSVGEVRNEDGSWPNDSDKRDACFTMHHDYVATGVGQECLWDIYQCVDKDDPKQYGRAMMDIVNEPEAPLCDLYQTDVCTTFNADFVGAEILPIITNVVMGMSDAFFQTYVFWLIGVMAGPSIQLSVKYAACYKGIQSLGASISWLSDLVPSFLYRHQAIVNIVLGSLSLIGSYFAISVIDKNRHIEEQAEGSGEAVTDAQEAAEAEAEAEDVPKKGSRSSFSSSSSSS